ncbi:hypothetical protein V8F06_004338 [Rhypophila decipiens]
MPGGYQMPNLVDFYRHAAVIMAVNVYKADLQNSVPTGISYTKSVCHSANFSGSVWIFSFVGEQVFNLTFSFSSMSLAKGPSYWLGLVFLSQTGAVSLQLCSPFWAAGCLQVRHLFINLLPRKFSTLQDASFSASCLSMGRTISPGEATTHRVFGPIFWAFTKRSKRRLTHCLDGGQGLQDLSLAEANKPAPAAISHNICPRESMMQAIHQGMRILQPVQRRVTRPSRDPGGLSIPAGRCMLPPMLFTSYARPWPARLYRVM